MRTEVRDARRARIILAAARGTPNQQIAGRLGIHVDTVRKWRSRFAQRGLDGLEDLPRTGRPRVFTATAVAEIKALACQLPADTGAPLSRWSHAELAAYDIHHARVIGRCAPTTGIAPFTDLVEQVMNTEPYASARRVFWIVDNGSSHNGAASVQRIRDTWPTARLIHLPVHASWLNQVGIYFSIVQRKVVKPQDFANLDVLEQRLLAFQDRYNTTAIPVDWRFGRAALHDLLKRVNRHEQAAP